MHTKQSLMQHLSDIGINPKGTLKVHLSYKSIGDVDGRGDTVLDALCEYMKDGLLVMASHTWDNVTKDNPVMDVLYTPTCVGKLTELFRHRPGVYRSLHPTHSVAALGVDAEDYISGEEYISTPCGKGGTYYKLWQRDAQVLLIGVNFNSNTYIHGLEEWDNATGTISDKKTDLYVINQQGQRLYTPQYRHCAPLGSSTFCKLEPLAIMKNVLTLGYFGDATTRLMNAKPLRALVAGLLSDNPAYLSKY